MLFMSAFGELFLLIDIIRLVLIANLLCRGIQLQQEVCICAPGL